MEGLSWELITSILDSIVGGSLREIKVFNIKHAKNDLAVKQFLKKFINLLLEGEKCENCI